MKLNPAATPLLTGSAEPGVVDCIAEWSTSLLLPVAAEGSGIFSGVLFSGPGRLLEGYDVLSCVCSLSSSLPKEDKSSSSHCGGVSWWGVGLQVHP